MGDLVLSATNGSSLRSIRPKVHTLSKGLLYVKVQQIDILELGFAVRVRVRFRLPKGWPSAKQPGIVRQWEGLEVSETMLSTTTWCWLRPMASPTRYGGGMGIKHSSVGPRLKTHGN